MEIKLKPEAQKLIAKICVQAMLREQKRRDEAEAPKEEPKRKGVTA